MIREKVPEVPLDLKDRKILYMLAQEARTPPSVIAKQVGLSKDAVKYRIRQLEKKGVIYDYIVEMNTHLVHHTGHDVLFKFHIPPDQEHLIAEYFNSSPHICWSCYISGEYNYFAELLCRDMGEFSDVMKEIVHKFGEQLVDYRFYLADHNLRITQLVEQVYDGKGISVKDFVSPAIFPDADKRVELDSSEKKMLAVMGEDARLPIYKIAEKTGLTSEVVRYRLRKLRKEGVIIRTTPVIDYVRLGYEEYIVLFHLKALNPETDGLFRRRIQETAEIKYAYRAQATQMVFALFNTKKISELEYILKQIRSEFFDILKFIENYHITQHGRFTFFPEAMQK